VANEDVFIRVHADSRQAQSDLARTGAGLKAMSREGEAAGLTFQNLGKKMATTGQNMTRLGRNMQSTVTLPLLAAGGAAIKFASDFESAMTQVQT
jgi:hypothetical protein